MTPSLGFLGTVIGQVVALPTDIQHYEFARVIVRGTQAPTEIPYLPILLVLAILIPLLVLVYKKLAQ